MLAVALASPKEDSQESLSEDRQGARREERAALMEGQEDTRVTDRPRESPRTFSFKAILH